MITRGGPDGRVVLLLVIALAGSPVKVRAGAWTLDAGTGQLLLGGLVSTSTTVFDASRSLQSIPRYNKFELGGLVEYGATDWLTFIMAPQLQHIDIAAPIDAQRTGLGYTEFGGRVRLYDRDDWLFSAQTTLRVPGTYDSANSAAIGYTDAQVDTRALLGHSFKLGEWSSFLDFEVAQRFRTDGAPDEFHGDFTLGVRPAPRWLLLAQSFNVISEGAGTWGYPSYDYYKLQLSGVYELTPTISLQLGAFTAYTGRNALQENGAVFGAWFKF